MKYQLIAAAALASLAMPATAQTVSNTTPIVVVQGGEITSTIAVSGLSGNITGLSLTLNGLSHTYPDDLVFGLLNENLGLGLVFFSGVGGSTDVSNLSLTFSDFGSSKAPQSFVDGALTSGTYLPSNFDGFHYTLFDDAASFADYNGFSPDASWTLFVDDVFPADGGLLSGGWSLNFTTDATAAVPEPASWALMIGGLAMVGAAARRRKPALVAA